jgi:hypothetical protein
MAWVHAETCSTHVKVTVWIKIKLYYVKLNKFSLLGLLLTWISWGRRVRHVNWVTINHNPGPNWVVVTAKNTYINLWEEILEHSACSGLTYCTRKTVRTVENLVLLPGIDAVIVVEIYCPFEVNYCLHSQSKPNVALTCPSDKSVNFSQTAWHHAPVSVLC